MGLLRSLPEGPGRVHFSSLARSNHPVIAVMWVEFQSLFWAMRQPVIWKPVVGCGMGYEKGLGPCRSHFIPVPPLSGLNSYEREMPLYHT